MVMADALDRDLDSRLHRGHRTHPAGRWPVRARGRRSIRALVLRLVRESPGWGYRGVHGALATPGIKVVPSTVWEILKQTGLDPAPQRASTTWAEFLRSQADALLACDFIETVTLNGQRQYILAAAVITDFAKIPGKFPHRGGGSWPSSACCALFVRPGFQIHVIRRTGWCL
jgi:putative transposase